MATQYSSPPTRPAPVPSPNTQPQQDASTPSPAPQTPHSRRPRAVRSHTGPRVRPSKRETFLDDVTPVEAGAKSYHNGGIEKDPHDLAFSPKHVTRASVVDNMLLALDQFSNLSSEVVPSREPPSASLRYNSIFAHRRGNTVSSDGSSENEYRTDEDLGQQYYCRSRSNSSNAAFTGQRSLETVPSLFEEDEQDIRSRGLDPQRACTPSERHYSAKNKSGRRSGKSSGSSSVDLGHPLAGRKLGGAGNRRSQSFDFGSNQRRFALFDSEHGLSRPYNLADEIEAAPTPVVRAGPSRSHSPIRHNSNAPLCPIYDPASLGMQSHTKSSKSSNAWKGRAGTMATVAIPGRDGFRGLHEELKNLPPMPTYFPPPPHSPNPGPHKPSVASTADPGPAMKERPGFFRRVFGSRSSSAMTLSTVDSEGTTPREGMTKSPTEESFQGNTPLGKPLKQSTKDHPSTSTANSKEPQSISKKSSAFFRRRKKSVTEHMPAPLPLSLRVIKTEATEPSPVSSLRQVMDPYLAAPPLSSPHLESRSPDDSPKGFHTAHTSWSQRNGVSINQENGQGSGGHVDQASSEVAVADSKSEPDAMAPQDAQDSTFLADSSGAEEANAQSRHSTLSGSSDGRGRVTPRSTSHSDGHEGMLSVGVPSASTGNARVVTPSSESKTSHSPSSPTLPDLPVASKASRPSHLKLRAEHSDHSSIGSVSKDKASNVARISPLHSASDHSIYKSAPSTPLTPSHEKVGAADARSLVINISESPKSTTTERDAQEDRQQALRVFENRDENLPPTEVSAWLGDAGDARERVRMAYMDLFDWSHVDILSALRGLCARIALKGETQQVDRMLDAFSKRWCECNRNHGFKSSDVVHTICYSVLLLNTDLHLAEIGQKMTRAQFIRNTLPTIRRVASDSASEGSTTIRAGTWPRPDAHASESSSPLPRSPTLPAESQNARTSVDDAVPVLGSVRSSDKVAREGSADMDHLPNDPGPLVTTPFVGSIRAWESLIESVLKRIYTSISRERLPLFGAKVEATEAPPASGNLLTITGNMLRRSPSTLSKAASEHSRGRGTEHRLGTGRWVSKPRSRPQAYSASTHGSTRTSMDEGSSAWSPSMSSTWSKASVGKTLTSTSVDSFGTGAVGFDYQKSIGFANALSQAIIREESSGAVEASDEGMKATPLLEDELLELSGAPWAKEGSLKHKHHLDGVDKRAKDRNWADCFAVLDKGWMRLFSFSTNAKSVRAKAKEKAKAGGVFGGGNWMGNAEEVGKFLLRQTIASALPEPGYSKARPYVWALSLPTGAVHLFQVGTPDIVKEFVSTANYWSARLSKEPMMGGISNMEYGWSDAVINRALVGMESSANMSTSASRPSMQSSLRSSIDHVSGGVRPKLPGDKITIHEWSPPQQSMMASQLLEVDQLRNLQAYVKTVEEDFARHNELRPAMHLAFSSRHPNTTKAMANWEKKSSYLLREIVKFKTYVDSLLLAQKEKERVLKMGQEDKK